MPERADAMKKVAIRDMTHAEFAERMKEPAVILVPLGSQEQQGPHAPMGDFMLTERLAEMSARIGGGLAAPTLPFGHAEFFRSMPGGIQLRAETFCAVLEDMLGAFLDHGHERLLIFNGHTTNASLIDRVARKIRRERGTAVASLNIWKILPERLWDELYGEAGARVRGHGGEPLTSVCMHLFPELMRRDLARTPSPRGKAFGLPIAGVSGARFEGQPVQLPLDCHEVDREGLLGGISDMASADKGRAICDHIVGHTARLMRHLLQYDPRKMLADVDGNHD
ncbi:creatininase family protein [Rhizobiaceae bacterium BDR2-2]|uniref:Creatininase family protein n=1 Tax=Ectorhizobium quercum TaxID=2965071 RepID=A0AAE3MVV5_9HYPH|nr:creatininase family protein [Ectorhizobium quercum]MCX8995893.1 creatininase family protein [Ectorhizobium quercum]